MYKCNLLEGNISFNDIFKSIDEVFTLNNKGLFIMELPSEFFCDLNFSTVKHLIDNGFNGVYVSFQRPIENICSCFKELDIDIDKIHFLDGTKKIKGEKKKDILPKDVEKIFDSIYSSLKSLKGVNKFVIIDSLTTMALINTESWSESFSDYLVRTKEDDDFKNIIFLVNVAKELSEKSIVKEVCNYADGILNIDSSSKGYSVELIKPNILA